MKSALLSIWTTRRHAISTVAAGTIIAIATWPVASWTPWGPGIDESFTVGYHLAAQDHMLFGRQLAFTYGPLGFLAFPVPYLGWTSILALAFAGVMHWASSTTLLLFARRAFPLWAGVGLAYLAARAAEWLGVPERMIVLTFIVSVWLLGNRRALARPELTIVALGILAGFSVLGKFNAGVVIAAIALLTASQLLRPWWRGALLVLGATSVTALGIWLLMGQQLADLPSFLRLSLEEVAGYSSAMGVDPGPQFQWFLGYALVTLLALAGLGWFASRGWPWSTRIVLLLVGLGVAFAMFKGAFVRWHYLLWFASAIPVTFAFMWDRRLRLPSAAVVALTFMTFLTAAAVEPARFFNPLPQVARAIDQSMIVAIPSVRHAALAAARDSMRAGYRIDPAFIDKVRPYTVHIDPWEAGVAFAFPDLHWRPLPVFQSYGVYTAALDEANANYLASSEAPERIIRMPPIGFDGRFSWFEQPSATVQMVCRYRQVDESPLFARVSDRCGPADLIASVHASVGQTLEVPTDPRPNRMIAARLNGVESSIIERLVAFAWKAEAWSITLNGTATYRLVPGTAQDLHILSIPGTVGWAPPFDYPTPTRTINIGAGTSGLSSDDRLSIDFFSIPVEAP